MYANEMDLDRAGGCGWGSVGPDLQGQDAAKRPWEGRDAEHCVPSPVPNELVSDAYAMRPPQRP